MNELVSHRLRFMPNVKSTVTLIQVEERIVVARAKKIGYGRCLYC
jgi:hypothetical protein